MAKNHEQVKVEAWRIVDSRGNQLAIGTFQVIARKWSEIQCQPGADRLEYLEVHRKGGEIQSEHWIPTSLLPASVHMP